MTNVYEDCSCSQEKKEFESIEKFIACMSQEISQSQNQSSEEFVPCLSQPQQEERENQEDVSNAVGSPKPANRLSQHELSYSRAIISYSTAVAVGGMRPDLLASLAATITEDREPEAASLWEMCHTMAAVGRDSSSAEVLAAARKYLETSHVEFVR